MFFVQQADRDIPSELLLSFLKHHRFLPLFEKFEIAKKGSPFQDYIRIFCQTWLFCFIVSRATAFPVFDYLRFKIKSTYFCKTNSCSSPIQLKMKFRKRIILFRIRCHNGRFCFLWCLFTLICRTHLFNCFLKALFTGE
ncbi:hypothetical protein D3C86_1847810 [compost metagenome]